MNLLLPCIWRFRWLAQRRSFWVILDIQTANVAFLR